MEHDPTDASTMPSAGSSTEPSTEERNWAMVGHLGPIFAMVLSAGGAGWLVPLVIWLIKRDTEPWIATQAKEALNFQLTLFLGALSLGLFALVTLGLGAIITIPGLIALAVANIVLAIIATVEVNKGNAYRYPMILRLI